MFQANAFQTNAFQVVAPVPGPAFQADAFQNNAFQVSGGGTTQFTVPPGFYQVVGVPAVLRTRRRASAAAGAYALAGQAAIFVRGQVVAPQVKPGAAFVYPNLADTGVIMASSAAALMPPKRLQDPHVARKWRGTGNATEWLAVDLGSGRSLDTVALMGLNLTRSASIRVRVSNTDPTGSAGEVYDSDAIVGVVDPNYRAMIHLLIDSVVGRYVRIDLNDAVAYVEAGRLLVGLRRRFEVNFSAGWSRGWTDLTRRTVSRGGQTNINRGPAFRTVEVTFDFVSRTERDGLVEDLDRLVGQHDDVLLITEARSDNLGRDSIWGLFDDTQPVVQPYITDTYRKAFRISERL